MLKNIIREKKYKEKKKEDGNTALPQSGKTFCSGSGNSQAILH